MKEIEEGCDNRRPTLWTDQCNRTGADISVCCIQMTAKHLAESMWKWMWSVMCCCIFVICIGLARAWVHQLSYWCHGKSMTSDIRLYPHVTQMRSWADCQSHGELHGKSAEQTVTVCVWAVHPFRTSSCLICYFMLSFILPHAAPNPNDFFTLEH